MEQEIKNPRSRPVSLLLTIPALLFGIISAAMAVVNLGLIPLVPAGIGFLLVLISYIFFRKSYRIFTLFVFIVVIGSAVMAFFQGVVIEKKVAVDTTFDSAVNKAQENIDSDLSDAFSDEAEPLTDSSGVQAVPENPPVELNGEGLYVAKCAACHMQNGNGVEGTYPPLAGSDFLKNTNKVIEILLFGSKGKTTVNGKKFPAQMPSPELSDTEIEKILNYVFSAWGNSQKPVTLKQITTVREGKSQ
jgi:mono/diheme cytochrome c family protein